MKYFFANWKENTNYPEALTLASKLRDVWNKMDFMDRTIVIMPPSVFLVPLAEVLSKSNVFLGAQDVSQFEGGAHTGEISAKMIEPYVKYVLLGHSERRLSFGESSSDVNLKIKICISENLFPVVCLSSRQQLEEVEIPDPNYEIFIVYEPAELIGGEEIQKLDKVYEFYELVKAKMRAKFIYGGSINDQNASELLRESYLDGLLIGHSSLDAEKFGRIISLPNKI